MGRVHFTSRMSQFIEKRLDAHDKAVLMVITDADRTSAILAPKLTRALVKSKKITRNGEANYSLSYGNSQVPYARRRHFENELHPETLGYLERGGDAAAKKILTFIEKV